MIFASAKERFQLRIFIGNFASALACCANLIILARKIAFNNIIIGLTFNTIVFLLSKNNQKFLQFIQVAKPFFYSANQAGGKKYQDFCCILHEVNAT